MKCGKRPIAVELVHGEDAGQVMRGTVCLDPSSPTGVSVWIRHGGGWNVLLPFGRRSERLAWAVPAARKVR